MMNRRQLLHAMAAGSLATTLPGITFAKADTDARLVLVVLRGAVDGLALAAPYGESKYRSLRGELALDKPGSDDGLLKLDGMFGLHPSMKNAHQMFLDNEAVVLHAIASPYRERSHFDGQDVLENGSSGVGAARDGWLNRALQPIGGTLGNEPAIALAQTTPLVLRGSNSVTSWAPSRLPDADTDVLRRVETLYAQDEFFSTLLRQALESQEIAGDMGGERRRRSHNEQIKSTAQAAAKFLTASGGPQIAVVESGGWDTHANQGSATGSLANKFSALDSGIAELRKGLGEKWSDTVVVVVTEFGRTVSVNGTRGTDHGTATAALLLGGAVNGGKVVADWPGLAKSSLYQGRDLYPTTDLRSMFKAVLVEHLGVDDAFVDRKVFPGSASAKPLHNLIRV